MNQKKTGSKIIQALENGLREIRRNHNDVPDAVINIEVYSKSLGLFGTSTWASSKNKVALHSISICHDSLSFPAKDIFGVLMHEAAHGICSKRKISDTSRQNRYHNQEFATVAKEIGLVVSQRCEKVGFGFTTISEESTTLYKKAIQNLNRHLKVTPRQTIERPTVLQPIQRIRIYCNCKPPRMLQLKSSFYKEAPLICGACKGTFSPKGTEEPSNLVLTAKKSD